MFTRNQTFDNADGQSFFTWGARQNKLLFLTLFFLLGKTNNAVPQNTKPIKGKYCADLGFGWQCIDFKRNGKCKITFGHSYWSSKSRGKWIAKSDTILVIYSDSKSSIADTSYYYFKSDTLYSISYQDKIAIRGKALIKQD